ncbi:MAG: hypothetical protein HFH18_14750 [Ruminococcus sp.]|nr:hypothetical protein [Ruminococcus sp.]
MNSEREQALKNVLEQTAADLKALSLAVDTICLGLERESIEPQVTASLKTIGMSITHIQQNISNALTTEQDTR